MAPAIRRDRGVPPAAWLIAAAFVVLEVLVSNRYGFQQDELYFLAASHHLAFGYVDQPPLAVLLARTTDIFGEHPAAIRILPALAGGAIVVLAARLAALFDGGRTARVLAALTISITPVLLGAVHVGNTTPYDLLAWAVVTVCVATALLRDRPRWWLGAGIAAGIGIEDDYLILILLAALVIGILVTSAHRDTIRTRWPWLGGIIALAIWAPNLVWQSANGWPQLTMASACTSRTPPRATTSAGCPRSSSMRGCWGFRWPSQGSPRSGAMPGCGSSRHRHARPALRPGLDTGEGVLRRRHPARGAGRWVGSGRAVERKGTAAAARRVAIGALALVGTVLVAPSTLPLLPAASLHKVNGATSIADGIGWPQLTADVAAQDAALTRAGRPPTSIFTGAYAEAGALDLYGGPYHLPPVISGHNTFWLWGPGAASDQTVLYVDAAGQLTPYFANCHQLATYNPPDQVTNDWNDLAIGVCTDPAGSWKALWPRMKHYD